MSQLCDNGNRVVFDHENCAMKIPDTVAMSLTAQTYDNMLVLRTNGIAV